MCESRSHLCSAGPYQYTSHLRQLDGYRPLSAYLVPASISRVRSPLSDHLKDWCGRLQVHPDREFSYYILHGLEFGFRVGFDYRKELCAARRNMQSALEHSQVVEKYLGEECEAGRILGPFHQREIPGLHVNRFGVIPKGRVSRKWRLITDLSFPEGANVNEGICPALCTLTYTSVDRIARAAQSLGLGALLAKTDVKSAYRLVPVHPED